MTASPARASSAPSIPPAAIGVRSAGQRGLRALLVHLGIHARPVFLFVCSLGVAYVYGWNNTDLVWGFWTTSLIVGNLALLRGIASPLVFIRKKASGADWARLRQAGLARQLGVLLVALVLLCAYLPFSAFMVLHFTVFHLAHAWLLQGLFPHPGVSEALEGAVAPDALAVARILLASYWALVLQKLLFDRSQPKPEDGEDVPDIGDWMRRPYLQVARIHLLLIVVIGLNALDCPQGLVYASIFTLFFFPLEVFRPTRPAQASPPTISARLRR